MKICLLLLSLIVCLNSFSNNIDSLKIELLKAEDINQKIVALNTLAFEYNYLNLDSSLYYAQKAWELSFHNSNYYGMAASAITKGTIYDSYANFEMSFKNLKVVEAISKKFSYWDLLLSVYNNLGALYMWSNDKDLISLKYFKKHLSVLNKLNNPLEFEKGVIHNNIGNLYLQMDSLSLAYHHFNKAIEISTRKNDKKELTISLYGKLNIHVRENDFINAQSLSKPALELAKEINYYLGISAIYHAIGIASKKQFDYNTAIVAFDSCIVYAEKISEKYLLESVYNEISEAYYLNKDYKNAYKYVRLYEQIKDEINREKLINTIAEIEAKSLIEQKEKELGYFKNIAILYKRIAENEKRNKYFLLFVFVFAITIAISNLHRILPDTKSIIQSIFIAIVFMLLTTILIMQMGLLPKNYQYTFFLVFVDVLTIATLPIFFIVLILERIMLNKNIKTAKTLSNKIKKYKVQPDKTIVNFQFENDSNTLSIAIKDLICIEANDNYAAFYYYHNDKVCNTLYRATLKSIEAQLKEHKDVIRCHKSYLVNITYIKHISGNAKGYKLHIDEIDFDIPVSRNFPKEILGKF